MRRLFIIFFSHRIYLSSTRTSVALNFLWIRQSRTQFFLNYDHQKKKQKTKEKKNVFT